MGVVTLWGCLNHRHRRCYVVLWVPVSIWIFWKLKQTLSSRFLTPPAARCKVKCYGEGSIHEAILKKLNISGHDGGPGVPCILFVYKVSRENEDLRNALRCITENGTTQKEDIFVVFLLTKISKNCKDVGEEKITGLDLFHEDTKVFRILWKDTSGFWPGFSCPEAIRTVTEKICQNNMRSQGVGQRANIWPNVLRLGLVLGSIRMLALLARLICRPVA